MPRPATRLSAHDLEMLLVTLIWGANFSVSKFALERIPPLPFSALRFFASSAGALTLCYGGDLGAPRYDLALLAPRLVGAAAHEAALGPEAANASAGKGLNAGRIFWGVLVVAVLSLLALLARLTGHRATRDAPK